MSARVRGFCPMGCGQTLVLGSAGFVTCSWLPCPRPDAVSTILADSESEHVVELKPRSFTVRHPLHERLDDALMSCRLHERIAALSGPPAKPGRYRVVFKSDADSIEWTWTALDQPVSQLNTEGVSS